MFSKYLKPHCNEYNTFNLAVCNESMGDRYNVQRVQSPTGGPAFVIPDRGYDSESGLEASVRCGCHVKVQDKTSRRANTKLVIASFIALFFMIGEVLGE